MLQQRLDEQFHPVGYTVGMPKLGRYGSFWYAINMLEQNHKRKEFV